MNTASPETPFLRAAPELKRLPRVTRSDRTRLVKDVLRVGRWYVGDDAAGLPQYQTFTQADLDALAARFAEHQAAGIPHSLTWGHRKPLHNDVQEADAIEDIGHMWAEDDGTLWIAVYVTEPQEKQLTEKHRRCSVGLDWDWRDGTDTVWPGWSITHVGIVSHATVPNQHPFIQMATGGPSKLPKGKRMTFDVMTEGLNQLLEKVKPGTKLPESVTEDNFDETFPIFISAIVGEPASDEPPPADAEVPAPMEAPEMPVEMSAFFKSVTSEIASLRSLIAGQKAATAEAAFRDRVASLGADGVPAAATAKLIELGSKTGWDQACIETVAAFTGKKLELGSHTGSHRSPKPANRDSLTPEAVEATKTKLLSRLPGGGRKSK